jgi:hypothetical protein
LKTMPRFGGAFSFRATAYEDGTMLLESLKEEPGWLVLLGLLVLIGVGAMVFGMMLEGRERRR